MNNPHDLAPFLQEHINAILNTYDKDKNACLDKEELRNLLADGLGVAPASITQDQLDWHFSQIDENHDGKITFTEYVLMVLFSLTTSF
jgi:Ca2+-binding EF-hand superfamily protein